MRVIAGSAKSLRLKTLEGMGTRPTTDRIKETLFNIISPSIYDSIFLDLFSGSGGIGIEALSRGAREAVFVENNPKSMACIKENLKFTRLETKAAVRLRSDALKISRQVLRTEGSPRLPDFFNSRRGGGPGAFLHGPPPLLYAAACMISLYLQQIDLFLHDIVCRDVFCD